MFVIASYFRPNLIFAGKGGLYKSVAPQKALLKEYAKAPRFAKKYKTCIEVVTTDEHTF